MSFTADKVLLRIALITSLIQFTNALEYMMFNPIFAFMASDFGVSVSAAGYVSAAYTAAAVISGIAAFYCVDRFDKRQILMLNMLLLGILTLLLITIHQFYLLLILRFCAGLVGGTTTGVAIGLLINASPAALRGKMLAVVISSFSVVSILGMPTMLYLCTQFGWRSAMWGVFVLCLMAILCVLIGIPPQNEQKSQAVIPRIKPELLMFAAGNGLAQFSTMLVIPILVPVMTQQLGSSNSELPWLFFSGGIAGYIATKVTGNMLSRYSESGILAISTAIFIGSLALP
jgi:predicted MFS family arabinose efflux permease